ncbi:MAG TPA: hypothetical protein VGD23_12910 [Sphingomicrobium sp.]
MLPLTKGIYVVVGTPCKGASNADTLSYWGDDNGINGSKTKCRITRLTKKGATYSLQRACTEIQFNGSFNDETRITVRNRTSFTSHARPEFGTPDRTYRYCGTKVQF